MSRKRRPSGQNTTSASLNTTSLLSQSLASILPSPAPLVAPPNSSTNNPPPRLTPAHPTTSTQPTTQPQWQHTTAPNPAPPPAQSSAQLPNPHTTIFPPTSITQGPFPRHLPTTWQPVPARIHHRSDTVRSYCAPGSNGWVAWQERRVAESQAEIGRIDYSWTGGVIIDFAERRRVRRQRTMEWIGTLDDEGGEEDDDDEKKKGKEESRKEAKTVKEGIKRKEMAVEDSADEEFYDCLETFENTGEEEDGSLDKDGKAEEDDKGGSQTCTDEYSKVKKK